MRPSQLRLKRRAQATLAIRHLTAIAETSVGEKPIEIATMKDNASLCEIAGQMSALNQNGEFWLLVREANSAITMLDSFDPRSEEDKARLNELNESANLAAFRLIAFVNEHTAQLLSAIAGYRGYP